MNNHKREVHCELSGNDDCAVDSQPFYFDAMQTPIRRMKFLGSQRNRRESPREISEVI